MSLHKSLICILFCFFTGVMKVLWTPFYYGRLFDGLKQKHTRGLSECALVSCMNLTASLSNLSSCPSVPSTPSPCGCSVVESSKVKLGSNTGGVFGIFWHLGERFQLIWDPCVHFDGFSGK